MTVFAFSLCYTQSFTQSLFDYIVESKNCDARKELRNDYNDSFSRKGSKEVKCLVCNSTVFQENKEEQSILQSSVRKKMMIRSFHFISRIFKSLTGKLYGCTNNWNARQKAVKCYGDFNRIRCYFHLEDIVEVKYHVCAIPASIPLYSVSRIHILLPGFILHYSQSLLYRWT